MRRSGRPASAGGDASSLPRKKAFSRADLLALQANVSKFQRDLDLQSALASDHAQSVEYVGGQVEALRNAYSTLSDVMVDEIEAVRTECRTLRRELHARSTEGDSQRGRVVKLNKALRAEVMTIKEDVQRHESEVTGLRAAVADTSLATKVAAMHEELQALRADNRELRGTLDTTVSGLREQIIAMSADMATMRTQLAEVGRLGTELDMTKAAAKEEVRQRNSLRTGIATCADGIQKLRQELTGVRASLGSLKQNHAATATALAQDVALLAEDAAASKNRAQADADKVVAKLKSLRQQVERQRSDGAESVKSKLVAFRQDILMQQEQFRRALTMVQKQQTRIKAAADEKARTEAADISALQTATRSIETGIAQELEDMRERLAAQGEESQRQFEAVSHAVHAFADIIHVSSPMDGSGAGSGMHPRVAALASEGL